MFLFMCCLHAHVRDSQRCRQAVFSQSNTCAKPPVYSNRTVLTGFGGDISSIQEGQSRLSTTTEADKSKPEKDNVLAWITKASTHSGKPYFSFARVEKCCSPSHLPVTVCTSGSKTYPRTGICQSLSNASLMEVSQVIYSAVRRVTEFHSRHTLLLRAPDETYVVTIPLHYWLLSLKRAKVPARHEEM